MGCGASKEPENPNKIEHEMKWTKVPKFDEFFDTSGKVLEQIEEIREGLQDTLEDMMTYTDVDWLKDPQPLEAVRVLLWSLSASHEGELKKTEFKVTSEAPFFDIKWYDLYWQQSDVLEAVKKFLNTAIMAPTKVPGFVENVVTMAQQASDLATTAKDEATNAGLGPLDAAKAAANTAKNSSVIAKAVPKVKKLPEIVPPASEFIQAFIKNIPEMIQKADEVGKQAHAAGIWLPREIFHKYHPGAKKTKEEYEAEKKKQGKDPKKKELKKKKKADEKEDTKDKKEGQGKDEKKDGKEVKEGKEAQGEKSVKVKN